MDMFLTRVSFVSQHLRRCSLGWLHGAAMPPMVTAQAMAALDLLSTERGKAKVGCSSVWSFG